MEAPSLGIARPSIVFLFHISLTSKNVCPHPVTLQMCAYTQKCSHILGFNCISLVDQPGPANLPVPTHLGILVNKVLVNETLWLWFVNEAFDQAQLWQEGELIHGSQQVFESSKHSSWNALYLLFPDLFPPHSLGHKSGLTFCWKLFVTVSPFFRPIIFRHTY